jgi:hypothetical protein
MSDKIVMKDFNKEKYNKLCADFLGCSQRKFGFWNGEGKLIQSKSLLLTSDLRFHSDWNWIMEVVEKIETLFDGFVLFKIEDESCFVAVTGVQNYNNYTTMATKKEVVVQAIWEFLNWYNINKK